MGYYTKFKFSVTLKKDLPEPMIAFLKKSASGDIGLPEELAAFTSDDVPRPEELQGDFFNNPEWYHLFTCMNWDDSHTLTSFVLMSNGYWHLHIDTEFTQAYPLIEQFVRWISPYIVGRRKKMYLGGYKGESFDHYINIYKHSTGELTGI